ncbi:MAG: hypothetical protein PHI98_16565, partial [Eubacteriales bacterium]|nr:hypothetical protein [Eubacteriales bacterium]
SGCYAVHLTEAIDLLMLNTARTGEVGGYLSKDTLQWMDGLLKQATLAGKRMLTCGHHPLLEHSVFEANRTDLTEERQSTAEILGASRLPLYLAGHRHIGHWSQQDGLWEILAGKTDQWPLSVGQLVIEDNQADFSLLPLFSTDSSTYLQAEAKADDTAAAMAEGALAPTAMAGNQEMIHFFKVIYKRYLTGQLWEIREEALTNNAYALWQSEEITSIFRPWIQYLLENMTENNAELHLDLPQER